MATKTPKDPMAMQPSEINRELDALDKRNAKNSDAFVAAGRGNERPADYRTKVDPLSLEAKAISLRTMQLKNEIARRYGPGAPSRLPRGFRPSAEARRSSVDVQAEHGPKAAPVPSGVERSSAFYPSPNYRADYDNIGGGVEAEDYESMCVLDDERL